MKKMIFAAIAASAMIPAAASAQEHRFEPYVGVMSGWDQHNKTETKAGIPPLGYDGWMVEGVVGANYNVAGPIILGVEGSVSKGIKGDIDWDYGAKGRVGVKAGKDSMIFGTVGYKWTNFDALGKDSRDFHGTTYGFGAEISPADLGGSADRSNMRLRLQVETLGNFNSVRPMAGLVAKF